MLKFYNCRFMPDGRLGALCTTELFNAAMVLPLYLRFVIAAEQRQKANARAVVKFAARKNEWIVQTP